ncbi:MAG: DUF1566 domain-containing protein [Nitrosomonadales bacterium]|nr:DUF1566 domain-containing protein [Nitrosomonadales bacterium]
MKRRKATTLFLALALGAGLFSANGANAALVSVLNGDAVYDTDLNVTWLANTNLAASNTFGVSGVGITWDGRMTWNTAQSWIGAMNTANYLGFNDWRLPTTLQPDASCSDQWFGISSGYGCTGSEMGHLFYNELGGVAGSSVLSSGDPDLALFQNGHPYYYYWSGTEYAANHDNAWSFGTNGGYQYSSNKDSYRLAWAVRPGNSAAVSAVPEPETYAMLLAGLGLLGFTARRKKNRAA